MGGRREGKEPVVRTPHQEGDGTRRESARSPFSSLGKALLRITSVGHGVQNKLGREGEREKAETVKERLPRRRTCLICGGATEQ